MTMLIVRKKKYQNIRVSKQVNISSSGHYHFKVTWTGGSRDYSLGVGFLTDEVNAATWMGAPAYLEREVERQIAAMFEDGSAAFYEYDRDGNKRWSELRYRDVEQEKWWVERLKGKTDEQ